METEVARRCLACGAAARGRAKFCPQCGSDMGEAPTLNRPGGMGRVAQPEWRRTAGGEVESPPIRQPGGAMPSSSAGSASRMTEQANETGIAGKSQPPSASSVPAEPDAVRTEAQSRPSGQSVRGDEGALSERAGKFREVSTGVLDEATDDPGGRFVLIACALFALFIVILIFSFILK